MQGLAEACRLTTAMLHCNYKMTLKPKVRNTDTSLVYKYWYSFFTMKPTGCTNFSNLFLEWNSTCFGQFLCPSSGVFHCTHGSGICHTGCEQDQDGSQFHSDPAHNLYDIYHCHVYSEKLLMMTEELPKTCRVSFQE